MWEPPQAEVQRLEPQHFEVFSIGASFAEVGPCIQSWLGWQGTQLFLNRTEGPIADWSAGSLQSCAIPQGFLPLMEHIFSGVCQEFAY